MFFGFVSQVKHADSLSKFILTWKNVIILKTIVQNTVMLDLPNFIPKFNSFLNKILSVDFLLLLMRIYPLCWQEYMPETSSKLQ